MSESIAEIFAAATEVPLDLAQPGDFVFPKGTFVDGLPSQIQIYIGGDQVLEAPKSGVGVDIVPMTDSYVKRMDT